MIDARKEHDLRLPRGAYKNLDFKPDPGLDYLSGFTLEIDFSS